MRLRRQRSDKLRLRIVAILYAISVALVGAAHTASLQTAQPTDPPSYSVPDWVLTSLCRAYSSGKAEPRSSAPQICDACLLIGGPGLAPAQDPELCPEFGQGDRLLPSLVAGLIRRPWVRRSHARDPPFGPIA